MFWWFVVGVIEEFKIKTGIDNNNGNDYKFGYNITGRDWKGPGGWRLRKDLIGGLNNKV